MNSMIRLCQTIVLAATLIASPASARDRQEEAQGNPNHFSMGLGIVLGSDFGDALSKAYSGDYDISGGGGFLDIDAGFGIRAGGHFSIIPRLHFLGSQVSVKGFDNFPASEKAALVFIPGVDVRYAVSSALPSVYANAGIGLTLPSCDLSRIDPNSGGATLRAAIGYAMSSTEVEIGYTKVPVELDRGYEYYYGDEPSPSNKSNWGGVTVTFRARVSIR